MPSEVGRAPFYGSLPPEHKCRIDDLDYSSVGDWYTDHMGRVPIQAAWGLDQYMKKHNCTFAEAYVAMTGPRGPIIFVQEEVASDKPKE